MLWAQNSKGLDRHLSMLISSGGRLSGFLAPKQGMMNPEQILQTERDWRTVVDTSDAAKRLQILAAPVDFTKTTLTPAEMNLIDLMAAMRDDLLALWGMPLSAIGIHERGSSLSAQARRRSARRTTRRSGSTPSRPAPSRSSSRCNTGWPTRTRARATSSPSSSTIRPSTTTARPTSTRSRRSTSRSPTTSGATSSDSTRLTTP